jgi:hypothetical protein
MSSLMKRPLVVLTEAALATVLLSACGGGGNDPNGIQADASAAEASEASTVVAAASEAGTVAAAASEAGTVAAAASEAGTVEAVATEPAGADASASPAAAVPADGSEATVVGAGTPADAGPDAANLAPGDTPENDGPTMADAEFAAQDAAPVEDGEEELANAAELEHAEALTIDSGDKGYAKPKVAALDYENNLTTARRDHLAKFKFVILGARGGSSAFSSFTAGIKAKSPSTKIAYYTIFSELKCSTSSTDYYHPMVLAANSANFWLRYADGSKAQWTSQYSACDMNVAKWGLKNSAGRTWVQEKARFDYSGPLRVSSVDYVFSDNTFHRPRINADWKRIRTNQSRDNTEIQSAMRAGQAAYWSAIKAHRSSLKIVGNVDGDLSNYEYRGKLNGAFIEGAMGKSYSLETWAGWDAMMTRVRTVKANTAAPNDVFLQAYGTATDYAKVRYGLASAMLEDAWFVYLPSSGTLTSAWFDEYDAPIGTPAEAPPRAPKSNGIYMRKFTNGIVLVNPRTVSATINVGSGYKRLKGTQSPSVNSGQAQTSVTLPPRSGLIMIKV